MQKKIWSKGMGVSGIIDTEAWQKLANDVTFTPEEDITVVGFELITDICAFVQVDGFVVGYNTLYKGPIAEPTHLVGRLEMIEEWRSLLGAQEARFIVNAPLVVMYPSGSGLSIVEGDTMVLTTWVYTSAALHTLSMTASAIIYYLRERAR